MSARLAEDVVNNVVNMKGVIVADGIDADHNGTITLSAGTAGVYVSGKLQAQNTNKDADGSESAGAGKTRVPDTDTGNNVDKSSAINISGNTVNITGDATLDASGARKGDAGGTIGVSAVKALAFRGNAVAKSGGGDGKGGVISLISDGWLWINSRIAAGAAARIGSESSDAGAGKGLRSDGGTVTLSALRMLLGTSTDVTDGISSATLTKLLTNNGNVNITGTDGLTVKDGTDVSTYTHTTGNLTLGGSLVRFNGSFTTGAGNVTINAPTLTLNGTVNYSLEEDPLLPPSCFLATSALQTVNLTTHARVDQALAIARDGNTVNFYPGLYDVPTLEISKSLILNGAYGKYGHATIMVDGVGFDVNADNVTVNGFRIWSTNDGIDVSSDSATITNNTIVAGDPRNASTGIADISGNTVSNFMMSIGVDNAHKTHIDNNTVTGSTANMAGFFEGGGLNAGIAVNDTGSADISGNAVKNYFMGISLTGTDEAQIDNNAATRSFMGIAASNNGSVEMKGNTLPDNLIDAFLFDNEDVRFSDNTLESSRLRRYGMIGLLDFAPSGGTLALTGNTFSGNILGAALMGGTVDLRGAPNTFLGGVTGLMATNSGFPSLNTTFAGDTLGRTVFKEGQSDYYVYLADNMFLPLRELHFPFGDLGLLGDLPDEAGKFKPVTIDASHATFDGVSANDGLLPLSRLVVIERKIHDYHDAPGLNLIDVNGTSGIDANRLHGDIGLFRFGPDLDGATVTIFGHTFHHSQGGLGIDDLVNITPAAGGDPSPPSP